MVGSPAEAADGAEVVCSIVPDSPEVTAVVDSVLKTAARGTVIVEMSTISPATARELAARCAEAGVDYLDCPVSGGPVGAEAGTLAIWVGGDPAAMERARPVLEVIGRADRVRHCGAVGAGLAVKLANNFLGAVNAAASAEALALAREAGVDPALVVEAVNDGTGANWQLANLFPRKVLRGDFEPGLPDHPHGEGPPHRRRGGRPSCGLDLPELALARARLDEARRPLRRRPRLRRRRPPRRLVISGRRTMGGTRTRRSRGPG